MNKLSNIVMPIIFLFIVLLLSPQIALANNTIQKNGEYKNMDSLKIMPDESSHHTRTWMAFVASGDIWSKKQIPEVKRDLVKVVGTIAKYEPVSLLVNPEDYRKAKKMLAMAPKHKYPIDLVKCPLDDLWLRDTGPVFVIGENGQKYGIDFNFNGWGNKQVHEKDSKVAQFITEKSGAKLEISPLILEGGAIEVDGEGTAIISKSCVINKNRNPNMSFKVIENELKNELGLKKIIWLNGIKGRDITDGHTDFYARFVKPGEVIVSRENYKDSFDYRVTRENIDILKHATDADGRKLKVIIIDTPNKVNETYGTENFAAGYMGYYLCNGAVIMQKFGDSSTDKNAKKILENLFPKRTIEQISVDGIASGGGTIHCTTQQEPKSKK